MTTGIGVEDVSKRRDYAQLKVYPREQGKLTDVILPALKNRKREAVQIKGIRTVLPSRNHPSWASIGERSGYDLQSEFAFFNQRVINLPLRHVDPRIIPGADVRLCVGELQSGIAGGMEINGTVVQLREDRVVIEPTNPDILSDMPTITAMGKYELKLNDGVKTSACSRNILNTGLVIYGKDIPVMLDVLQPSLEPMLDDFQILNSLN